MVAHGYAAIAGYCLMAVMLKRVIIYDLDRTLTRRDTYLPFLFACLRAFGPRDWSICFFPYYALLYLMGRISNGRFKQLLLTGGLAGISLEQLKPVVHMFVSNVLVKRMNVDVVNVLQRHLKKNHRVILATASLDLYVLEMARRLGIEEVVCSRAEVERGSITGRLVGNNCHGNEKLQRLEQIVSREELNNAKFYTDHHSDFPVLSKVRHGILVRPSIVSRLALRRTGYHVFDKCHEGRGDRRSV